MPIALNIARTLPKERQEKEEMLLAYLDTSRTAKEIALFLEINVGGIYSKLIKLEIEGKIVRSRNDNNISTWSAVPSEP